MKSKIVRITNELAEEIERIARLNQLKFIEASREVAREVRKRRNRRVKREILF